MGTLAFLAVVFTIGDPGITIDEKLDVAPGRKYVETLWKQGLRFFEPKTVEHVYFDSKEHPPLGRWLLGIASETFQPVEMILIGKDPLNPPAYVRSGRVAPALCFAILVGLITSTAGRRYGLAGGVAGGFALAIMPRVFAHAHLGALDTFVALFWTWAFLRAIKAADSPTPIRSVAFAGVFWGLVLLTKIHGWLLPPVVFAWLLMRLPIKKAILAMSAWVAVGLIVFVVGWPWLWYDSWHRLTEYLNTGLHRTSISTLYFGTVYADKDVPWHYPWVYFVATVPLGLHVLGGLGVYFSVRERRDDPFPLVVLATILGWLALFSTKVPVYDGERLYLVTFPLWAILIGRGFGAIWDDLDGRKWLRTGLVAATVFQSLGVISIHPFGLSYYNVAVGGLKGAESLGMELTFWGDSVDGVLMDALANQAANDATAALAPTLAPDQGKVATSRSLARKGVPLQDQEFANQAEWVVVYRREAYWSPEIRELVKGPPLMLRTRQGVWLSGIWRR